MRQSMRAALIDISELAHSALDSYERGHEQALLEAANAIRNKAWDIKEEIFNGRLLEAKITDRTVDRKRRQAENARRTSASLDDLLDLL